MLFALSHFVFMDDAKVLLSWPHNALITALPLYPFVSAAMNRKSSSTFRSSAEKQMPRRSKRKLLRMWWSVRKNVMEKEDGSQVSIMRIISEGTNTSFTSNCR